MYNDVNLYGKTQKLQNLIRQLVRSGFRVYITADHGNTPATGRGKLKNMGVETESRSSPRTLLHQQVWQYKQRFGTPDHFQ